MWSEIRHPRFTPTQHTRRFQDGVCLNCGARANFSVSVQFDPTFRLIVRSHVQVVHFSMCSLVALFRFSPMTLVTLTLLGHVPGVNLGHLSYCSIDARSGALALGQSLNGTLVPLQ